MDIILVTIDFPYPTRSGGDVAVYNRIKELGRNGHNIYLFVISKTAIKQESIDEVNKYCKQTKVYINTKYDLIINELLHPLMPIRTAIRFNKKLKNDLAAMAKTYPIDIIMIEHGPISDYLPIKRLNNIKSVLILEGLVWKSWLRIAKNTPKFIMKMVYYIEFLKTKRLENNIFKSDNFDEYWFYSIQDMNGILNEYPHLKDRFKHIPIGVELKADGDIEPLDIKGVNQDDKIMLIIGNMSNPSNEDAARWFAQEIFPTINMKIGNAKLLIVGKNSCEKLSDLANQHILVIGEVHDLKPYLYRCDLHLVPQRGGSGVRVKLLDGLSAKKIVLATPVGVEALENIRPNIDFLLARDPEEFAQKAIDVLNNQENYRDVAENGFEYIRKHYSIEVAGHKIECAMLNLIK